jgi:hypothetical protein
MPKTISQLPAGIPGRDWIVAADSADGSATTQVQLGSINDLAISQTASYPSFGGSVSGPTVSLSARAARWYRIGPLVHYFAHLTVSSVSGGSGNLHIAGLPFRVAPRAFGGDSKPGAHPGALGVTKGWLNTPPTEVIAWPNTFQMQLASAQTPTSAWAFTPVANLQSGVEINLYVVYITNDP